MKKPKRASKISDADKAQMDAIYKVRAILAHGVYLTPMLADKTTNVRLSFTEKNFGTGVHVPVASIVMSIEDIQATYNALTELLQQMRTLGRIA